jgi:hypothetical protein
MTSFCVSISEQTTGKCNLFFLYNEIEKIAELWKYATVPEAKKTDSK